MLVLVRGRRGHDLELRDALGALADGGADAVGAGVAAADHDDVLALGQFIRAEIERLVRQAAVLLRQEVHGVVDTAQLAAGHCQIARLLGAARQQHGIVLGLEISNLVRDADVGVAVEHDSFGFHLLDAAVDELLFHFEIGNAVDHQPAGTRVFLVDMHGVAGACELLGCRHAGRARADDRHRLAGLLRRRLRHDPAFFPALIDDGALDGFDGHRVIVDVECARGFARRRADAACDFREIVGRVQVRQRFPPVAAIDQIVPIGDLVVDGAAAGLAAVAIGNAAIHAPRGLCLGRGLAERHDELAPRFDALLDRLVGPLSTLEFHEACDLAHRRCFRVS